MSFADLYAEHFKFVWRNLRRMGLTTDMLDDAAQDVFVVVHRRLPDFEPRQSVKAWLFRILTRISRDHLRRRRRKSPHHRGGGAASEADTVADPASGPVEQAERNDAVRKLHRILLGLAEQKRDVFILADLEEMPASEIAEALAIPLNTVYSRLRSARSDFDDALRRLHARERNTTT